MSIPWGILISLIVVLFAVLIKYIFSEVLEDEHVFLGVIGIFLAIYIAAAVAVGALNPLQLISSAVSAADEEIVLSE